MKISNTLSGKKEDFIPSGETVSMYVCGITPQSEAHIGHAMSYINFDVIRRYLIYRGYKIKCVQNFTDIDDKIIIKAAAQGISITELAEKNMDSFMRDMTALNISPMDQYPRATQEIAQIIVMVQGLIDKGYAYIANKSVYFRVTMLSDYGKLSNRSLDQMLAGARIEPGDEKENPMDFVLWKAAKPAEASWDSPWGKGRPGWHIECSAMVLKYLGDSIDIHGGGADLLFPHHENEIAQSESYTGKKPYVKYWMHNGLLRLGDEKMSKSTGNIISIKQLLENYTSDALRVFILSSHYRSPLTYTQEALEAASSGAKRMEQALNASSTGALPAEINLDQYKNQFIQSMDDDFNTPQALAVLFDLIRELNRKRDEGYNISAGQELLRELSGVLGLKLIATEASLGDAEPFIRLLLDLRNELRQAKQYAMADKVRNQLEALGITIEDTSSGTTWKKAR